VFFVGGPKHDPPAPPTLVTSFAEFVRKFGGPLRIIPNSTEHYLYYAAQHFFAHGGTRCYVVRTAHYTDISTPTSDATAAESFFNAVQIDAVAVNGALRVAAASPGTWGTSISVEVKPSSKFQVTLAADIAAAAASSINLAPNDAVVPGTVLHLVREITGVVASVDAAANTVRFSSELLEGSAEAVLTIPAAAKVFKPDFSFTTTLTNALVLTAPTNPPTAAVQLGSVAGLAPGDAIHFIMADAMVRVYATEATGPGASDPMRAVITQSGTQTLPALPKASTRAYARDFTVRVGFLVGTKVEVAETHPNLSLIKEHPTDYVNVRLGEDSGASQYIVANEVSTLTAAEVLTVGVDFAALGGTPNDGLANLSITDFVGSDLAKNGLHALDPVDDASILVIAYSRITSTAVPLPKDNQLALAGQAIAWVENRKDMFYIIDPPRTVSTTAVADVASFRSSLSSSYAALYFPWIEAADQLTGQNVMMPPSGAIAGIYARSDGNRGVHKAPAGIDVGLVSTATGTAHLVTRGENDVLYPLNINAIRNLTDGIVVWGSRTIAADPLWLQISIRRLFIFIERSIQLGTNWVVFEPNDLGLWKTIEKSIKGFLRIQWLEGKLVGATEEQAFFVRCNGETNPPEVVDAGMVITEIGVAPSRPAEFVVFRIFQFAGRES
jgi:phage tail sheath protein FI